MATLTASSVNPAARLVSLGFVDALAAGFLAATALPVLRAAAAATIGGAPERKWLVVLSVVPVGVLLGATVGLGLWRQAVVARAAGVPARTGPVVAGVGAGALAGQLTSLAGVGLGATAGFDPPWLVLLLPAALAGATALVASLGALWAEAVGRWRGPAAVWLPAVVLAAALFTVAAWVAGSLAVSLEEVGWRGSSEVLQAALSGWPVTAVAVVLAGAAAVALAAGSRDGPPPAWLVPGAAADAGRAAVPALRAALRVGLLAGAVGVAVVVAFRLTAGPAADDDATVRRVLVLLFVAATTGASAGLALLAAYGAPGLGAALLAGPLATAVVGLGIVALNAALGGGVSATATATVLQRSLALGLLTLLAVAWLPLTGGVRSEVTALTLAAALAAASASGVVLIRDVLVPLGSASAGSAPAVDPEFAALDYRARIGPAFFTASDQQWTTALAIEEEPATAPARAARYRAEVLPQARDLLASARAFLAGTPEVAAVHAHCIAALELAVTGYEELAAGYETERVDLLEQGAAHLGQHVDEWLAWGEAVDELG